MSESQTHVKVRNACASPLSEAAGPLLAELRKAWQEGSNPAAEEILARHPEVGTDREVVLRLAYEEVCLR
jgi:hypothetical protein